jgi:hypothetical protein
MSSITSNLSGFPWILGVVLGTEVRSENVAVVAVLTALAVVGGGLS